MRGKPVQQCQVIERADNGRWVLCVDGEPRIMLPETLGPDPVERQPLRP